MTADEGFAANLPFIRFEILVKLIDLITNKIERVTLFSKGYIITLRFKK
jgi:hypothetical protein